MSQLARKLTIKNYVFCYFQVIQTVYFGLSVWNDISGGNVRPSQGKTKQGLQKFLDMFMASIVYPVGTVRTLSHIDTVYESMSKFIKF